MNHKRTVVERAFASSWIVGLAVGCALLVGGTPSIGAQAPAPAGKAPAAQAPPPPRKAGPLQLEVIPGTKALYKVQEQMVGINFPDDAVGETETVTGKIVLAADGSIDAAQSKLTVDLRTIKSDQDRRDNAISTRTLEVAKFPLAEFVARRMEGIPNPVPNTGQAGFKLIGDMTIHGVTSEVTWTGYITFFEDQLAGRVMTVFPFAKFGLTKPQIARLVSVEDKIQLEIAFKLKVS